MTKERKKPGRPKEPQSKRTLGVDRHISPRIAFHYPWALDDALEAYLASIKPTPGVSAVMRLALEEYLARRGFWTLPADKAP